MDACPLLITSIVAVKPEDQGTFFQDFLGLSGYLCSVPEMLRTTMKPNGSRYPLVGGTRGRRFAGTNLKPHKLLENAQTPTTMAPAKFAGDRVHGVLGCVLCETIWL